jgi:sugar phosphate isomerase/epimerase
MKLGFITSILDGWTYEEMIDVAADLGYQCVEVACWPKGKAERRYSGVCHIDAERVLEDDVYCSHIADYAQKKSVGISALAYYPNMLDPDLEKREANISHLKAVILASAKLHVNLVTTFIGREQNESIEENLEEVKKVWPSIIRFAEGHKVRIAIENCPMLFDRTQWPGGQNLFCTPENWKKIFNILDSDYLGINYDPSHFVWQMMDYIQPIYDFRDKIFHIHYKDIKLIPEKLKSCGTLAYPLEYMTPKIPGLGDVDWGKYVSALTDIGYDGPTCIEVEDKAFEGSRERILDSLKLSKRYMEQFVV